MRSILLSLAVVMLAVLSACDGDSETSDEGAGEDSSATEIATSEGSGAAAPDGSDTANDGGEGGGGDATGGTSEGDIEQFIADLEPPNSSGTSRDVRDGITYITWETSESLDALQGFLRGRDRERGLHRLQPRQCRECRTSGSSGQRGIPISAASSRSHRQAVVRSSPAQVGSGS